MHFFMKWTGGLGSWLLCTFSWSGQGDWGIGYYVLFLEVDRVIGELVTSYYVLFLEVDVFWGDGLSKKGRCGIVDGSHDRNEDTVSALVNKESHLVSDLLSLRTPLGEWERGLGEGDGRGG